MVGVEAGFEVLELLPAGVLGEAALTPCPRSAPLPLRWRKGVREVANLWFANYPPHPAGGRGEEAQLRLVH